MQKFRLVTFDVTNTLLQFRSSVGQVYADTANLFKVSVNVKRANHAFRRHFGEMCKEHPNFGAATGTTSQEWWSQVVSRTLRDSSASSVTAEKADHIARHLFLAYSTDTHWKPDPGAHNLLRRLKSSGVSLGVISNFDERLHGILEHTKLKSYFDFVIASYVVQVAKPNRAIFDEALRQVSHLNVSASSALHVGDNYQLDYVGACEAGWNALLVGVGQDGKDHRVPDFASLESKLFDVTNPK